MRTSRPDKRQKIIKQTLTFYPLLFAIYPVVALAAFNIAQIDFSMTYRSIIVSLVSAGVLWIVLHLVIRNWMRAALLSTLLLVLFFSYGHVYNFLKNPANPLLGLVRHRILGSVWIGLAGFSIWLTTRKFVNLTSITLALNIIAVALFLYPVYQIAHFEAGIHVPKAAAKSSNGSVPSTTASESDPDIYYIILDGYMRADNLKVVYNFDNSAFLNALTQRGFYVADCSQSNYAYTELSLASSLNMDYLDTLGASNNLQADGLIQNSSVRSFLKNHEYTIVAFETGFHFSQWEDADVYYKYAYKSVSQFNSFETLLLTTTLFRAVSDKIDKNVPAVVLIHDRILSNLDILNRLPLKVKGPKFVFDHLVIPHPPYIYKPNGDFVMEGASKGEFIYDLTTPSSDRPGYPNAVLFINSAILKVVDSILANSKIPPVIIIQGDHGAFRFNTPEQRMSILNAYYFPNSTARASLYPSITPVNTFRILFDSYFGQNFSLLDDVSQYSVILKGVPLNTARWTFETVPNQCN